MTETDQHMSRFGFQLDRGGAHTARTAMLVELRLLLNCVEDPTADRKEYARVIREENCLGKPSHKTRTLSYRHLVELYGLDPSLLVFRALLFYWFRDARSQPLLALLCAYARDPLLRASAPLVRRTSIGESLARSTMEELIETRYPGRFSPATVRSTAQNLNSTWTQSGHLAGRARKVRVPIEPTLGSLSYALLLGYLSGARGEALFQTEYSLLLDCSEGRAQELAAAASRQSWIVFKRLGKVMEVGFPHLITPQEMEWIHESY